MKFAIDTDAAWHRIRRALWKFFQFHSYPHECADCGKTLTTDEHTYYGRTCERCEGILAGMWNEADDSEPRCSAHPDAPHGFNRNASHNAGRYVCDCEGWIPDDVVEDSP